MRALIVAAACWAGAAFAQPYFYLDFKMLSDARNPFPVYMDDRSPTQGGLAQSAVRAASEEAWATWNAVACARPKVISRGNASGVVPRPSDPYDSYSVTPVWIATTSDPDYLAIINSTYIAAITLPRSYAGVLESCDTYLNGANFRWSLDATTPRNVMDLGTVMLHEAGHCLGLDHFGTRQSTMYQSIPQGLRQHDLSADDMTALCERNPTAGVAGAPCDADGGCADNASLKCLTQPVTNGQTQQLCSNACSLGINAVCSLPLTCQPSSAFAGFTGACLLPGASVTRVGIPCGAHADCGSSTAICQPPITAPSNQQFWANGYCTQSCKPGQPACPAGATCFDFGGPICLQTCRVGLADCRAEYACVATAETTGVCMPRCYADKDCSNGFSYFCRTCDGVCASRNSLVGQIADSCTADEQCGPGQICTAVIAGGVKTCTQQCARGCGTCPIGSTCTPLLRGDLFCIKDCAGPGSCPAGLRCADTANGKGCLPACSTDLECAVGQRCSQGECYTPLEDSGCGSLCTAVDAGRPIVVTPKDAGTGGGGSGGCGCVAIDAALPWLLLTALGLFLTTRRSTWRGR
jgi:hypothetical protein